MANKKCMQENSLFAASHFLATRDSRGEYAASHFVFVIGKTFLTYTRKSVYCYSNVVRDEDK